MFVYPVEPLQESARRRRRRRLECRLAVGRTTVADGARPVFTLPGALPDELDDDDDADAAAALGEVV